MTKNPLFAGEIALAALEYLASNEEEMAQFLALSGLDAEELRNVADTDEFQAGLLDYFLHNESALVSFCEHKKIAPEHVTKAAYILNPVEEF